MNDIVAGLQAVILDKDLNSSAIEDFGRGILFRKSKAPRVYIKDLWLKEPAFFSTVLLTDPKAICNDTVKRTLEGGLGDHVVVQYDNGYYHEVPISEERAVYIGRLARWELPDDFPKLRDPPGYSWRK